MKKQRKNFGGSIFHGKVLTSHIWFTILAMTKKLYVMRFLLTHGEFIWHVHPQWNWRKQAKINSNIFGKKTIFCLRFSSTILRNWFPICFSQSLWKKSSETSGVLFECPNYFSPDLVALWPKLKMLIIVKFWLMFV